MHALVVEKSEMQRSGPIDSFPGIPEIEAEERSLSLRSGQVGSFRLETVSIRSKFGPWGLRQPGFGGQVVG